jgi:hypothetical protein
MIKNLLFSLFAIGLAGLAAIAATTALLNAPVRTHIGPPAGENPPAASEPAGTPPATPPAAPSGNTGTPNADGAKPATPEAGKPDAAKPAGEGEPESDVDPYEGIAPEDLPPDLQYDADSSVSFPTNI